ncbi:MAG: prepilin-type N-terminal cleavage/methylation domain-containing protein [Planctomycetes bacterium]|nr:prepilin-type N-terminal cleavage/methylation domain-containing protein [Planctomycetota bacterium]
MMRDAGFTLVELMVVIAVLAVLTATILPELSGTLPEARLRADGRRLGAAIRLAASQAATRNREHCLRVDPDRGEYWIEAADEQRCFAPLDGTRTRLEAGVSVRIRAVEVPIMGSAEEMPPPPDPAALPEALDTIRFRPDGTADGREILLREPSGLELALAVNPTTAAVRIAGPRAEERP